MKKAICCLAALAALACTSNPKSESHVAASPVVEKSPSREPAQAMYSLYKWMIVDSTNERLQAAQKGQMSKVCNASNQRHRVDTQFYAMYFEVLRQDSAKIPQRLREELGPAYNSYVAMENMGLPNKLHEACIKGSTVLNMKVGKDPEAVKQVMQEIANVMRQEPAAQ